MGLVATALTERRARAEARALVGPSMHPSRLDDPRVIFGDGLPDDHTGMHLGEREVLGFPAVLQACRLVSWAIGMTPCQIFEKSDSGATKLKAAEDHPLYWLLHDEPHPEYTPFEWKSAIVLAALFRGNWYGQQIRTSGGPLDAVFPLDSSRMTADRVRGKLWYRYDQSGGVRRMFKPEEICHVRGFMDGGLLGLALQQLSPTSLAKGVAMERFGARVFRSGMTAGALVEEDADGKGPRNADERKELAEKLRDALTGEKNWHNLSVLPPGMKLRTLGINAKEALLIDALNYQVQDISRLTGVPPALLMDLSHGTFTNTEQQMLMLHQLVLGPWFVNLEQRFAMSFLSKEERRKYVIKFNADALLRTDLKTRYESYRIAVGRPWMSPNEARDLENLQPIEGGDIVLEPLNMGNPGGDPDTTGEAPPQDGDADTGQRSSACSCRDCAQPSLPEKPEYRNAGRPGYLTAERRAEVRDGMRERLALRRGYRGQITRDAQRLVRAELREVRKILASTLGERDATDFETDITTYYQDGDYAAAVRRALGGTLENYARAVAEAAAAEVDGGAPDVDEFLSSYIEAFIARKSGSHLNQLLQLLRENLENATEVLEQRLDEWEEKEAEKIGSNESVKLADAVTKTAWVLLGVTQITWIANSGACPLCEELDGRVVGIERVFVEASDKVDPGDDKVTPLVAESNVGHPPLHGGCECSIGPS